jgi:arylsulfatase A-like enzyme
MPDNLGGMPPGAVAACKMQFNNQGQDGTVERSGRVRPGVWEVVLSYPPQRFRCMVNDRGQVISFEEAYRDYMRCLLSIDDSVGEITRKLESKGLLDDTLIVYMGDNGYLWGEHGLVDKRAMYEPSMRVPLIAHCPALFPKGQKPKQLVLNLDIAPTLLEAAGVTKLPAMHGRSWLPLLQGRTANWRQDFVYEYAWERDYPYTPTITGLRTQKYSFMLSEGLWDIDELYDLENDIGEKNNVAAANPDVAAELNRLMISSRKEPSVKAFRFGTYGS